MGVEDFYLYIQEKFPDVFVQRDLLKMVQAVGVKRRPTAIAGPGTGPMQPPVSLCLVIDGECCMDRLYGGYFTDWSCGGQWNRVVEFLRLLFATTKGHLIEVCVFFNGALETGRFQEWRTQQLAVAEKVRAVLQHVRRKHTPPPKLHWVPPAALRNCLRLALRNLMIPVFQTVQDHRQEIMTFLREKECDALLADGAEFFFFDPPCYLSAPSLRLTFKGSLDVKEVVLEEVAKLLNLHPSRFCLVAAMLGNFILPEQELKGFYGQVLPEGADLDQIDFRTLIPALCAFARNLPSFENLHPIGSFLFRNEATEELQNDKTERFVASVHYYMNATGQGFQKYFKTKSVDSAESGENLASDLQTQQKLQSLSLNMSEKTTESTSRKQSGSSSSADGTACPSPELNEELVSAAASAAQRATSDMTPPVNDCPQPPPVSPQILNTALHRHNKGFMHPWIYQVLCHGEIKLEAHLEEGVDMPMGHSVWRGLRQAVYAILFDLNHKHFLLRERRTKQAEPKTAPSSEQSSMPSQTTSGNEPGQYPKDLSTLVRVKEWLYMPKRNEYEHCEWVSATALGWRGVPTLRRLWFEKDQEHVNKRMKAFLSCMMADTSLMMDQQHVPQHLLVLCCVLRYLVTYPEKRLVELPELDAFLSVAVSPQLMDPATVQEIPVQNLSARGVQLASLLMQGVEHAMFANDACGSPVPWSMLCPWLFFDGKLFQLKLDIANRKASVLDLCNGELDRVSQVERMRQAVLEGLELLFPAPSIFPAASQRGSSVLSRGRGRRDMMARGGQLEVGGVVVSQWKGGAEPRLARCPFPAQVHNQGWAAAVPLNARFQSALTAGPAMISAGRPPMPLSLPPFPPPPVLPRPSLAPWAFTGAPVTALGIGNGLHSLQRYQYCTSRSKQRGGRYQGRGSGSRKPRAVQTAKTKQSAPPESAESDVAPEAKSEETTGPYTSSS